MGKVSFGGRGSDGGQVAANPTIFLLGWGQASRLGYDSVNRSEGSNSDENAFRRMIFAPVELLFGASSEMYSKLNADGDPVNSANFSYFGLASGYWRLSGVIRFYANRPRWQSRIYRIKSGDDEMLAEGIPASVGSVEEPLGPNTASVNVIAKTPPILVEAGDVFYVASGNSRSAIYTSHYLECEYLGT